MAETIGVIKSISLHGTTYPNAFANLKIINLPGTGLNLGVTVSVYTDQAYFVSNPEDPLAVKSYTINITSAQHETIFNTIYTRLIAQIALFNGATQVT